MPVIITAYSGLTQIDALFDFDGHPIDPVTRAPLDAAQIIQIREAGPHAGVLQRGAVYTYTDSAELTVPTTSTYEMWMERLAKWSGYPELEAEDADGRLIHTHRAQCLGGGEGPFAELIGVRDVAQLIGSEAAAKLAADFEADQDKIDLSPDIDFRACYASHRALFEMASDGGCVVIRRKEV